MGRPIPQIRAEMHELADEIAADGFDDWAERLRDMAEDTKRVPFLRKVKPTSDKMTAAKRDEIILQTWDHPNSSQQEIAVLCNVSAGRVSETLAGKWDHLK